MSADLDAQKLSDGAELTTENSEGDSTEAGYCRPPKHSRFKPGQSGNPLGRPKGTVPFASELADELSRTILVRGDSGDVHITAKRLIVKKLVAAAIAGDAKVAIALISLCAKHSRRQEADPRAAEDDAFVEKLAAGEPQAAENDSKTISSPKDI
jgi:hypothetical protein